MLHLDSQTSAVTNRSPPKACAEGQHHSIHPQQAKGLPQASKDADLQTHCPGIPGIVA